MAWLDSLGREEILLPGFVVMELIQGCRNRAEQNRIEKELTAFRIAWPTPATYDQALSVFSRYHLSHRIGLLDALIGQIAVALDLPLHTFNQRHYAVIPGIKLVQPYEKGT